METILAVLMALGIFLVIPLLIAWTICGTYFLVTHKSYKQEKAKALQEAEKMVKKTPDEKAKEHVAAG